MHFVYGCRNAISCIWKAEEVGLRFVFWALVIKLRCCGLVRLGDKHLSPVSHLLRTSVQLLISQRKLRKNSVSGFFWERPQFVQRLKRLRISLLSSSLA